MLVEKDVYSENIYKHPMMNFYYKLNDLSINLEIKLKWLNWGFEFLDSLKTELLKLDINDYNNIFKWSNDFNELNKNQLILLIDNFNIENRKDYENRKNFYSNDIFNENVNVHLKLHLNLFFFLILNHLYIPVLTK